MASYTFTLSGHTSTLSTQIYPPINLSDDRYALGLISFSSYHTIPNVDRTNNKFIFQVADQTRNDIEKSSANLSNKIEKIIEKENKWQVIKIPTGSYEIGDIERFLQKTLETTRETVFSQRIWVYKLICFCYFDIRYHNFIFIFKKKFLFPSGIRTSDKIFFLKIKIKL